MAMTPLYLPAPFFETSPIITPEIWLASLIDVGQPLEGCVGMKTRLNRAA
jgi:hypothetical protein